MSRWRLWVWVAGFRVVIRWRVFGVWWLGGGMRFLVFLVTGGGMLRGCLTRSRGWRGSVIRGMAGFLRMWRGLMRGFLVLARVRRWRWIRSSGCFWRCGGRGGGGVGAGGGGGGGGGGFGGGGGGGLGGGGGGGGWGGAVADGRGG